MLEPILLPIEPLVDEDGRPLQEWFADPALKRGVAWERIECPYAGSRHRHRNPMNMSALRQINIRREAVDQLMRDVTALAGSAGRGVTLAELWWIGRLGESLPGYLVYRAVDSVQNHHIPALVAAAFKIFIGYNVGTMDRIRAALQHEPAALTAPVELEAMLAYYEREQLLIGPREVCSGPDATIRRVLAGFLDPPTSGQLGSALAALVGDGAGFVGYARALSRSTALSVLFAMIAESLYAGIVTELGPAAALLVPAEPRYVLADDNIAAATTAVATALVAPAADDALAAPLATLVALTGPDWTPTLEHNAFDTLPHARGLLTAGLRRRITFYFELERIYAALARVLKHDYLAALGRADDVALAALAGRFVPPLGKMRSLLGAVFNVDCAAILKDGHNESVRVAGIIDKAY